MVVRRERAIRKNRGSKTGWGGKKKHRGSGSRGGHGFAGSLGHKRIYVQKNFPGHIGKRGFTRPTKIVVEQRTINVGDLERLAKDAELDLTKLGYTKLLAKGSVNRALRVIVTSYTQRAKQKLEKAGGAIAE